MPEVKSTTQINHGFIITGKILVNNTSYDLTSQILQVGIKYDYLQNVFPLYSIKLKTTETLRNIIRDNEVKFFLSISYYDISDSGDNQLDSETLGIKGTVFEGIIRIYEKPYSTTASFADTENVGDETQADATSYCEYEISGIPEDIINKNEETINIIYSNCQLFDAVVNLITTNYRDGTIYIQDSNRSDIYKSILIPPINLTQGISFLDEQYDGIYDKLTNFFIDENSLYLYDVFENGKKELISNYLNLNVLSNNTAGNSSDGWLPEVDENNNINIKCKLLPSFTEDNKISTHELGSNTTFYYYDENFNLASKTKINSEAYKKVRYMWEPLKRKSAEVADKSDAILEMFSNIHPGLISPLTKLVLTASDYPRAEGNYSIISKSVIFTTDDLKHFSNRILIHALKK